MRWLKSNQVNKDWQEGDKKMRDVRQQYHSNKNYTYCDLMTDWG